MPLILFIFLELKIDLPQILPHQSKRTRILGRWSYLYFLRCSGSGAVLTTYLQADAKNEKQKIDQVIDKA